MKPESAQETVNRLFNDNWPIRRRYLGVSLIWMAANVEWIIWRGLDALSVQLALSFVAAVVALICAYVFGATWDDREKRLRMPRVSVPGLSPDAASEAPCASDAPLTPVAEPDVDTADPTAVTTTTTTEIR